MSNRPGWGVNFNGILYYGNEHACAWLHSIPGPPVFWEARRGSACYGGKAENIESAQEAAEAWLNSDEAKAAEAIAAKEDAAKKLRADRLARRPERLQLSQAILLAMLSHDNPYCSSPIREDGEAKTAARSAVFMADVLLNTIDEELS